MLTCIVVKLICNFVLHLLVKLDMIRAKLINAVKIMQNYD